MRSLIITLPNLQISQNLHICIDVDELQSDEIVLSWMLRTSWHSRSSLHFEKPSAECHSEKHFHTKTKLCEKVYHQVQGNKSTKKGCGPFGFRAGLFLYRAACHEEGANLTAGWKGWTSMIWFLLHWGENIWCKQQKHGTWGGLW